MSAGGLIGLGTDLDRGATRSFGNAAGLESIRRQETVAGKAAEKAQAVSQTATGAGIGFAVGGPVGAGIGALAGFAASKFF